MNIHLPKAAPLFKWPRVRLGDIAEHRLGKMLDKEKNTGVPRRYLRNPNIRWFDFDLSDLQEILVEEKDVHKYEIRDGDVLICEGGEAGRAAHWKGDSDGIIFQKACHRVRVGPRLDANYLIHRLFYDYHNGGLEDYHTGATIKHFTGQDLARYEFPLPPLDEQRQIAAILDKADALRRKCRHAIELLESLTQSILLEMFGDPNTNPLNLARIPLGDLIRVRSGNGLVAKDMAPDGRYPVYGGNGVNGYHDRFMFEEPKIVLGRVGVYCGAVHITDPTSWVTDNALYVSEIKRPMSLLYLAAALRQANFNQYAGRSAQPLISGGRIYPVEIAVPDLDDQQSFEKAVKEVHRICGPQSKANQYLEALFSSLQSCAFLGQL
ncbi:restriction endonuclease subunit S [Mesorhizobium sp. AR07]|uniref:restriction endonuclease subunit S n=1 Tax=Mesorhizobium sp. AR07 TaxID=2865838 RepID=UPI00215F3D2A|nr:restriction endonuclease subunit S [Mesorhizobium sp. AR07]UVK43617.1 restriction endonuclease subunit S [Mesorhizobium sp. AR07]